MNPATAAFRRTRARILIVDDKPTNIEVIRALLADQDLEILGLTSGREALDEVEKLDPDLLLLDIAMPGMDGIEVCSALRDRPQLAQLPILFVTAMGRRLEEAFDAGGSDFVTKPVHREELVCRIRTHLQVRTQFRALEELSAQLQHEREIARLVMDSVTRKNVYPGGLIEVYQSPQNEFSGDLVMTAVHPEQGVYLLVADFTGHGLAAAIGTVPLSLTFHSVTREGVQMSLGDFAFELNHVLLETNPEGMFCAAMLARLEANGRVLHVWQGGMPDSYLLGPDGSLQALESAHMPLAAESDAEFDRSFKTLEVEHGARLVCLSDGLAETFNEAQEMFGEERIREMLRAPGGDPIREIPEAVQSWRGAQPQDDDLTMVQLTCQPPSGS